MFTWLVVSAITTIVSALGLFFLWSVVNPHVEKVRQVLIVISFLGVIATSITGTKYLTCPDTAWSAAFSSTSETPTIKLPAIPDVRGGVVRSLEMAKRELDDFNTAVERGPENFAKASLIRDAAYLINKLEELKVKAKNELVPPAAPAPIGAAPGAARGP